MNQHLVQTNEGKKMQKNMKQNKIRRSIQQKRPPSVIIPDDIMELARGKPLYSRQNSMNSRGSLDENKRQIGVLLEERQKFETELFKLPTNPRSLGQRKKKQHLEAAIVGIE